MIFNSKAPLRIGLAGGGTDVSPYSDQFGGAVLNATISMYAHVRIIPLEERKIIIERPGSNEEQVYDCSAEIGVNDKPDLIKAVYNRLQKDHRLPLQGFRIITSLDVPAGSGLGASSTLAVTLISAFASLYGLSFTKAELAQYAYDIERNDLCMEGGRQDQYAATFGGFNFMEFGAGNKAIITKLPIGTAYLKEMEERLVLYYTSTSRESAAIIREQVRNVNENNRESIEAMHRLKEQAAMMRNVLLNGRIDELGPILDYGFRQKKLMAANISNSHIEAVYEAAKTAGATGGKISGAGGGGFMIFYCPEGTRYAVIKTLNTFGGLIRDFSFVDQGAESWKTL